MSVYLKSIELKNVGGATYYPYSIPALKNLTKLEFTSSVTFFTGENGSGKSTLLEAIAVASGFNAEGGSRNIRFNTRSSHSSLHESLKLTHNKRPLDGFFLRAESFFNLASEIEHLDSKTGFGAPLIRSYGGVSLHEQSHGQSFLALLTNRLGGDGLYIFDEPEAALSPVGQFAALRRIHELAERERSQFIIATHSPLLMAYPDALIYEFSESGVRETKYRQTENYMLYKRFLNDEGMLREVLS